MSYYNFSGYATETGHPKPELVTVPEVKPDETKTFPCPTSDGTRTCVPCNPVYKMKEHTCSACGYKFVTDERPVECPNCWDDVFAENYPNG